MDAMHPAQALQTIAAVRHQRERLTSQAAGQIWMVWGLVLGLIGFASQSAFHARFTGGWIDPVFIVVGGAIGAVVTNAVWRSHAFERAHRAWIPYALAIGGLLLLGSLIGLSNLVDVGAPQPTLYMAPIPLMGAFGAALITATTRHRVSPLAGWTASTVLLAGFVVARFVPIAGIAPDSFLGNMALNVLNLAAFTVVGWIHFRQG